jgi:hypothetical protein
MVSHLDIADLPATERKIIVTPDGMVLAFFGHDFVLNRAAVG